MSDKPEQRHDFHQPAPDGVLNLANLGQVGRTIEHALENTASPFLQRLDSERVSWQHEPEMAKAVQQVFAGSFDNVPLIRSL